MAELHSDSLVTGDLPAIWGVTPDGPPFLTINADDDGWEITLADCTVTGPFTLRGTGPVHLDAGDVVLSRPASEDVATPVPAP